MDVISAGVLPFTLLGLVVGTIAGIIMKEGGFGLLGDIILGIIGSVIGGLLIGTLLGVGDPFTRVNWISMLIALIGSVVTVTLVKVATHRRVIES